MWQSVVVALVCLQVAQGQWFGKKVESNKGDSAATERCFCQLKGAIDDCSCSVETIDSYNNLKVYPRLNSLLHQDFFRYWKVNLNKGCPFWEDDSKCAIRYCSVQPCTDVPEGIKGSLNVLKTKEPAGENSDCDQENNLGYLNTTLSKESQAGFEKWAAHDSVQDSFCELDEVGAQDSQYVDLLLNPERFTGYVGSSAHRIWRSIYQENCFRPVRNPYADFSNIGADEFLKELCLEKRAFYRAISGLHSSINIHLTARYLLSDQSGFEVSADGVWGHNVEEFQRRFDPELTSGEGPRRLKNLYFLYLLELRAIAKAAPYLESLEFYTGSDEKDRDVRNAVKDLLTVVRTFPEHFDESSMFSNDQLQGGALKEEFRQHFRNISRIMDCVGCDKCRLWGKLQVTGLGTALKVLFSGNYDQPLNQQLTLSAIRQTKFQLSREEIVALFNAFGRLSSSIMELETFRKESLR